MKKLLKNEFLIYIAICMLVSTLSVFLRDFWSIPPFIFSVLYFVYSSKKIQYDIIEEQQAYEYSELIKVPKDGYEWLYTSHITNIIFLVINSTGLVYLISQYL